MESLRRDAANVLALQTAQARAPPRQAPGKNRKRPASRQLRDTPRHAAAVSAVPGVPPGSASPRSFRSGLALDARSDSISPIVLATTLLNGAGSLVLGIRRGLAVRH